MKFMLQTWYLENCNWDYDICANPIFSKLIKNASQEKEYFSPPIVFWRSGKKGVMKNNTG